MQKRNLLKIALITSVATFTMLNHYEAIKQNKQIRLQHTKNIKFKTAEEQVNDFMKIAKENETKLLAEKQKQKELNKQKQNNLSRGGNVEERTFMLTFYTSLDCENGYGAITCEGKKLRDGVVANNVLPLHTKLYLKGYGEVEILDRGGSNFNTETRLDVFVPRKKGESDYQYKKRVNNMGKVKVKGYMVK